MFDTNGSLQSDHVKVEPSREARSGGAFGFELADVFTAMVFISMFL
jgi:hypothetical protein